MALIGWQYSWASSRSTVISVGIISVILSFPTTYGAASDLYYLQGSVMTNSDYSVRLFSPIFLMLCSLSIMTVSILMVHGAVKGISGYLFPWLAAQFAAIFTGSLFFVSTMIVSCFVKTTFFTSNWPGVAFTLSVMMYFWAGVYTHYKQLNSQVEAAPKIDCKKEKILTISSESNNPYYSV